MTANTPAASDVAVTHNTYNGTGDLIRTETYTEGEELTAGRQITEHTYDEQGNEIMTRQYNTLDPSSVSCTELTCDKTGRTLTEAGMNGESKTELSYTPDGAVRERRLPDGSRIAYGYDHKGRLAAVTRSTADGEENSVTRRYTEDCVTELVSGPHTVRYTYDAKRRMTSVSPDGMDNYATIGYVEYSDGVNTATVTMRNGAASMVKKNSLGQITRTELTDGTESRIATYAYDNAGRIAEVDDSVKRKTTYTYDGKGRLIAVSGTGSCPETRSYTVKDQLSTRTLTASGLSQTYEYTYADTAAGELTSVKVDNATVSRKTDVLGREAGKSITHGSTKIAEEQIAYLKFGDRATTLPSVVRYASIESGRFAFRDSLRYRYSENGQITGIFANGLLSDRYEYDAAGRLIREDNTAFGKTTTWVYDSNGDRIAERVYPLTEKPTEELHTLTATETLYAYDGDRLLSRGNESITYDTVGNPISYRGHTLTWAFGRRLTAFGSTAFTYDARGRRTGKGNLTFLYDESGNMLSQSNGLSFLYDHTGLLAVKDGTTVYYCRKDPQGNILRLVDKNGNTVVKYVYDAWGHCKVCNPDGTENTDANFIGHKNPFRYRGYYFDTETGLYFLQTRYYDPDTGRFLSPDDFSYIDPDTVGGINLYAYCNGDPVDYSDPTGHSWESFWNGVGKWFQDNWVKLAIGAAFIIGGAVITALTHGTLTTAWAVFCSSLLSSAIQVGAGIAVSVAVNGLVNIFNGNDFFNNVGDTIASSFMWGGILSGGAQIFSGGARILRAKAGFKGINSARFGFMSPDKLYYKRAGMTLFRIGEKDGIKIAIDLGRYGIHAHFFSDLHIPLIPLIVGLIEAL